MIKKMTLRKTKRTLVREITQSNKVAKCIPGVINVNNLDKKLTPELIRRVEEEFQKTYKNRTKYLFEK